jgi:hypothetical protein
MNSNLLWCKNKQSTNRFDKGKVREMIENANIFLSRIINPQIRANIIKKNYFFESFLIILKMHQSKNKNKIFEKIIHSPTNITGILPGYMRSKNFYKKIKEFDFKEISRFLYDFDVAISPKIWVVDSSPGKWKGIESFGKIIWI